MAEKRTDLFRKLTRLFRSGPVVKRKVRGFRSGDVTSSALDVFRKSTTGVYGNALNAYGQYDRLSRYSDFCIGGHTLIYTTNGVFTIKELAEKYKNGERFHVYSYDHEKKRIVIAEAHSPRLSRDGKEQEIVRVRFDNGYIDATPDHKFLLRGGDYIEAKDLKPEMALMPLYVRDINNHGYKWIYTMDRKEGCKGGWQTEHRLIAEYFYGPLPPGMEVHHIDFNKKNNSLDNLKVMTEADHKRYHSQLNNKNKFGKPNEKHSKWMRENNPSKRHDITFEEILRVAIETDFKMSKVRDFFNTSANVLKRRLREKGFKNWLDFKSKRNEIQDFITHNNIVNESKSPEIEDIIEESKDCQNIFELCQKLSCSPNAIRRRLFSHGYGTWSDLKKSNGFDVVEGVGRTDLIDNSISYQEICNVYKQGMTYRELAQAAGTSQNKVLARIVKEGFKSYHDWVQNYNNHKVASVEFLDKKEKVYNLTVDKYHNLAAGSGDESSQVLVIIRQSEMEYTPEISSAIQIHAEETVAPDEKGRSLHIFSENPKIKELLEELFYDTLNIEFVLLGWVRNLCKYGDFFLFIDVTDGYGVINSFPVPVNEIEREEGWDPNDPLAVRFRWVTQGNQVLENWQVAHFRLQGNDAFLPYGSSILESARRIWRQLTLIEDAMLVYRVIRAPERRVFYIDVANVPPEEVGNVIEQARATLKSQEVIDKDSGRVDLRYNPWSVDIDYFIPVRGTEGGTKIDTLPGGTNTTAIDDVEYIQRKLFAALKVPKAYLGFDEQLSSKANLAQEDVRFSRAIQAIQKVVISELNKIATIHLAANGYEDDDLIDFQLALSNPSNTAQQQKLELIGRRFEIAQTKPEDMLSKHFIYREVFNLTREQIEQIENEQIKDLKRQAILDSILEPGAIETGGGGGGGGLGAPPPGPGLEALGGEEDLGAGGEGGLEGLAGGGEEGGEETAGEEGGGEEEEEDLFASEEKDDDLLLDTEDDEPFDLDENEVDERPIKADYKVKRMLYNRQRQQRGKGASWNAMPDLRKMNSLDSESFSDPNDKRFFNNPFKENSNNEGDVLDKMMFQQARMTREIKKTLDSMRGTLNINKKAMLKEDVGETVEKDIVDEIFDDGQSSNVDDLIVEHEVDEILSEDKDDGETQ